jgi:hypothetical protein
LSELSIWYWRRAQRDSGAEDFTPEEIEAMEAEAEETEELPDEEVGF